MQKLKAVFGGMNKVFLEFRQVTSGSSTLVVARRKESEVWAL